MIQGMIDNDSWHFRLGFKTRDLIGYWYYLMSSMQIVANEIARFKSRFAKTEVLSTFWCVFLYLMGVTCNLRFNVRVPKGSGKKVDKRYKKGYSAKYCNGFIAKVWNWNLEVFQMWPRFSVRYKVGHLVLLLVVWKKRNDW